MQFDAMPLIAAAAVDERLHSFDLRVLVEACRHLVPTECRALKLEVLASAIPKAHRGSISKSLRRLAHAQYVVRGRRVGIGGATTWRLPATPLAVKAKF